MAPAAAAAASSAGVTEQLVAYCVCLGAATAAAALLLPGASPLRQPLATVKATLATLLPLQLLLHSLLPAMRPAKGTPVWQVPARAAVGFPAGDLLLLLVAMAFGAPMTSSVTQTFYFALLMSALTVAPAACVLGHDGDAWQRVFAQTRPYTTAEFACCVPAHGAIVGAWIGAVPIPLDWGRYWQEWPTTCVVGALIGYVFGLCITPLLYLLPTTLKLKHA
eukprot:jgi/Chlat1/7825/Chrsp66S07266